MQDLCTCFPLIWEVLLFPDCPSNLSDIQSNTIYSGVAYLTPNVVSSLSSMFLLLLTVHLQSPDHIFSFTCLCGYWLMPIFPTRELQELPRLVFASHPIPLVLSWSSTIY